MPDVGHFFNVLDAKKGRAFSPPTGSQVSGLIVWSGWFDEAQQFLKASVQGKNIAYKRILYFPAGYAYEIPLGKTLEISQNEQGLLGEGLGSLLFHNQPSKQPLVRVRNKKFVHIEKLSIEASKTSFPESTCIEVDDVDSILIQNVRCAHAHTGIRLLQGQRIRVLDSEVHDCVRNVVLGEFPTPTSLQKTLKEVLIAGCVIRDSWLPGAIIQRDYASGIDFQGFCVDILVDGNILKHHHHSALSVFGPCERVVVSNNDISENNHHGVEIREGQGLTFEGNLLAKNSWCGAKLHSSLSAKYVMANISFIGNQIADNVLDGIDNEADYVQVIGNILTNNGSSTEGAFGGIRFHRSDSEKRLQTGIITSNMITKNRYSNDSNVGIQCLNANGIQINHNTISRVIDLLNGSSERLLRQDMGVYLKNAEEIMITGNTFEGYTNEKGMNPPVRTENASYTAANNQGLQDRVALATLAIKEFSTFPQMSDVQGELVYSLDTRPGLRGLFYRDGTKWISLADF